MSYLLTTKKHALLKGYWKNSTLWESFQLLSLATPLGLVFVYILYRGWLVESSSNNNNTHGTRPPPRHRDCAPRVPQPPPPPPVLTSRHIRKGGFGSTTGCNSLPPNTHTPDHQSGREPITHCKPLHSSAFTTKVSLFRSELQTVTPITIIMMVKDASVSFNIQSLNWSKNWLQITLLKLRLPFDHIPLLL